MEAILKRMLTPLRVRWIANAAFWILLAASVLPVWSYTYAMSGDGPSHIYNSIVYLDYSSEPVYQSAYTLRVPLVGNLSDRLLCMGLLRAGVPGPVTAKILVTICLIALPLAFRYPLRSQGADHATLAVLILPFVFNYPLVMGFWSFSLGIAAMLVCLAICFRTQGRWERRSALIFFGSALAVYACHPLCWAITALACGIIAAFRTGPLLWRPELRNKAAVQIAIPVLALLPFVMPSLLLARSTGKPEWSSYSSWRQVLWPFYTLEPLHIFPIDEVFARATGIVLCLTAAVALVSVVRRRTLQAGDVFLPCALAVGMLGIVGPERVGELSFLGIRFVLIAWIFLLLWISAEYSGRRYAGLLSLGVAAFTLVWLIARIPALWSAEAQLDQYVAAASHIQPGTLVCQIDLRKNKPAVDPLAHAIDLIPEKHIVDLNNYEAAREAFWTRFRPGYFIEEDYRRAFTPARLEPAVSRFEALTNRCLNYIVVIDPVRAPQRTLRGLLPNRWPEFDIEQDPADQDVYLLHHRCRSSELNLVNREAR